MKYNTSFLNFNRYHFDKMDDTQLINYVKMHLEEVTQLEKLSEKHDTYGTSVRLSSYCTNLKYLIVELKDRKIIDESVVFYWGVMDTDLVVNNTAKDIRDILF